jgi:hypothetical protein
VQVAIARRSPAEGPPKKVFVKCHNNEKTFQFDTARARAEVELLNRLSRDPLLAKHLPRLERTVWLESKGSSSSDAITETNSVGDAQQGHGIAADRSHFLMLEFDRRACSLLAEQSTEVRSCLQGAAFTRREPVVLHDAR